MKTAIRKGLIIAIITALITVLSFSQSLIISTPAEASVSNWQKGATMVSSYSQDFDSENFKQSVRNLRATGADYVTLVFEYHQATEKSAYIYAGSNTPTDETLISAIDYIHSLGMKVMLKPHVENDSGIWRGLINPTDRSTWFASYGSILNRLAILAETHDVESLCLGAELVHMTSPVRNPHNTAQWITLIDEVRLRYTGFITYSANWGGGSFTEAEEIKFWDHLDAIGISGYFPLATDKANPTVEDIVTSWNVHYTTMVKPLSDAHNGMKILFTEGGYRNITGAHVTPWDWEKKGELNDELQANLYEALFKFWGPKQEFIGLHFWHWSTNPYAGGHMDTDYTPQNKKAQDVITKWYGGAGVLNTLTDVTQKNSKYETSIEGIRDGEVVLGNKTVTAFTKGIESTKYDMFWHVDGGVISKMNSIEKKKEVTIDFRKWTWKLSGKYTITFLAKDMKGRTISEKSVIVYVH
ncbi:hypothetical protein H0W32_00415 [Patescibacteria group bacterium]|nr:hypothetical protein [Patescibacteria group bacterium]